MFPSVTRYRDVPAISVAFAKPPRAYLLLVERTKSNEVVEFLHDLAGRHPPEIHEQIALRSPAILPANDEQQDPLSGGAVRFSFPSPRTPPTTRETRTTMGTIPIAPSTDIYDTKRQVRRRSK